MPTATQLASVCAGTFNPAQTSATPLTLSTLHGLTRRSHAEGAGGAWLLAPLGRRWTERCSRQITCSGPRYRRVAPHAEPGTRGGGSGQWPFLPGEPAEGGPALLPVPPTAARARRPLGAGSRVRPGRANLGRSHHGEFKRTRGSRPCPVAGRTGKVSVRRGSLGARDRTQRLEPDPGRGARGCGDPRRPQRRGHGTRGVPGERVDSVSGPAGLQVIQVAVVPGSVGRNPVGCSVANPCLTFPGLVKGATWGKSHQRDTSQINPGWDLLLGRDLLMKID